MFVTGFIAITTWSLGHVCI